MIPTSGIDSSTLSRANEKDFRWWCSQKLLNLWIWKCHMKNVKVMCINLHMITFMYVLITSKEINIRHMESHMYWEEKKLRCVEYIKAQKSHLVRLMLKGMCKSGLQCIAEWKWLYFVSLGGKVKGRESV